MTNPITQLTTYIKESIAELKKVTWPTRRQTLNYTLLVVGISLTIAAFIGIVDALLTMGMGQIIK